MRIDLDHLRVFYAVAKAGSFTAAGEALHVSQSSVSRTIQLLEARLEVKLFERHVRGLRLTPQGERLCAFTSRFIEEASLMVKQLQDKGDEPQGELKVVTTPELAVVIMPHIPRFLAEYPQIRLIISGQLAKIDLREADALISTSIPQDPHLIQRPLKRIRMKLYASEDYLNTHGRPQDLSDLNSHKLLKYAEENMKQYSDIEWITQLGRAPGDPREAHFLASPLEALLFAAELGVGIVQLPEEYQKIKAPSLVDVMPTIEGPVIDMHYIYSSTMRNAKRITVFGEYLMQALAEDAGARLAQNPTSK